MSKYLSVALSLSFLAPSVFASSKKDELQFVQRFKAQHCFRNEALNACIKRTGSQFGLGLSESKKFTPIEFNQFLKNQEKKFNPIQAKVNESRRKPSQPRVMGKYTACNDWLQDMFPKDKMIEISAYGKISKGDNADETYVEDESSKTTTAAKVTLNPKDKNIINGIEVIVTKGENGTMSISRKTTEENRYYTATNMQMTIDPFTGQYYNGPSMAYYNYNAGARTTLGSQRSNNSKNTTHLIEMKIGENGSCYVSEVDSNIGSDWSNKAKTKTCHDLMNFKRKNPTLAKCSDPKVFKRLKSILSDPQRKVRIHANGDSDGSAPNGGVSLSQEFKEGLGKIHELVIESKDRLSKCDDYILANFVNDKYLFNKKQNSTSRGTAASKASDNN